MPTKKELEAEIIRLRKLAEPMCETCKQPAKYCTTSCKNPRNR